MVNKSCQPFDRLSWRSLLSYVPQFRSHRIRRGVSVSSCFAWQVEAWWFLDSMWHLLILLYCPFLMPDVNQAKFLLYGSHCCSNYDIYLSVQLLKYHCFIFLYLGRLFRQFLSRILVSQSCNVTNFAFINAKLDEQLVVIYFGFDSIFL